jgi:hypothetical protein
MEIVILVILKKINFQEKDNTYFQMVISIKDNLLKVYNTGVGDINLDRSSIKANGHMD